MNIKCNVQRKSEYGTYVVIVHLVSGCSLHGTGLPTMAIQMLRTAFHHSFSRAIA